MITKESRFMNFMKNLKIGKKLIVTFGVIIILFFNFTYGINCKFK